MNCIEVQTNFFNDNSPDGLLRQEFVLLHASTEKVRRGCYAKLTAQQKQIEALKCEIEQLKQLMGMNNEKTTAINDLPLFAAISER